MHHVRFRGFEPSTVSVRFTKCSVPAWSQFVIQAMRCRVCREFLIKCHTFQPVALLRLGNVSLQLSFVAFLLLKLVISPFVAYKIGKRLSEQMCSFSTTANALDFLSVPHEWFSHRTAAAFYGRRTMHHHLWQLNCHAQSHNNRQYGDKVLTQPLLPKNIMHPSRMHWLVIYWEVCRCLLSAKSMASNGLWKWPQNRWICQEGKRT